MQYPAQMFDALVVGAGLAGLMVARRLTEAGLHVLVFESESKVGGRLATCRIGGGRADSGAQFFTIRTPVFESIVYQWLADGWVYEWSRGWSAGSRELSPPDGYPRYAAHFGFAALAQHLAEGLDVRVATTVSAASQNGDGWQVTIENGGEIRGRTLILTPPVPHSLALLDAGNVKLPVIEQTVLGSIHYGSCLCGIFVIDGGIHLPETGAFQWPDQHVSWIANNQIKGISPDVQVLTVHASPVASAFHWSMTDDDVLVWMAAVIRPWLALDGVILETELKRWPLAIPTNVHPDRCLISRLGMPLIFAGDAFNGPRVEGAVLSGLAAASAVLQELQS